MLESLSAEFVVLVNMKEIITTTLERGRRVAINKSESKSHGRHTIFFRWKRFFSASQLFFLLRENMNISVCSESEKNGVAQKTF